MTRELIEEAAEKHSEQWLDNSDEYFLSHHRDVYEYGFTDGVYWLAERLYLLPWNEILKELHEYCVEEQEKQQSNNA